jgi:hypothetical protein
MHSRNKQQSDVSSTQSVGRMFDQRTQITSETVTESVHLHLLHSHKPKTLSKQSRLNQNNKHVLVANYKEGCPYHEKQYFNT